jgi:MFS family permease
MSLLASWSSPALAKLHGSLSVSEVTALEVSLPLGAALGVMVGWIAIELCGRKSMLLLGGFASLIAWLLLGLGEQIAVLCAGRITGGIAIGLINISSSLYIPEIAPVSIQLIDIFDLRCELSIVAYFWLLNYWRLVKHVEITMKGITRWFHKLR